MHEHHLTVPRTARYFTLGDPEHAPSEIWVVCHGYGQLAERFLRHFDGLVSGGSRLIVAPEGLSRFYLSEHPAERRVGASWMTREDRLTEIEDYVRYLDAVYTDVLEPADRSRLKIVALGFSQGAATVSRWAALGGSKIDHVVLWGGELPPDLDLGAARERLRRIRFSLVYGVQDEYITQKVVDGIAARLREHGIPHSAHAFAGGHELDADVLRQLAHRE